MGTTFSPAPLNFGGVDVGSQAQLTVTITSTTGTTVTGPSSPYVMSPASPLTVPANTPVTVTITFSPTGTTSYADQLQTSDSPATTCALAGFGQSLADKYESEADSTETPSEPAGDPDASGKKYYQIAVPNFTELGAISGVTPTDYVDKNGNAAGTLPTLTGAHSFLRLGTPPSQADVAADPATFQNSMNLARLVGDPWAVFNSENMSLTGTPTTVVGNVDNPNGSTLTFKPPSAISIYSQGQDRTTSADPSGPFTDAFVDGFPPIEPTPWGPGTALSAAQQPIAGATFGTAQDPNFLLGFADDVRWRGQPESSETINSTTSGLSNNNNLLSPESTLISNQQVANVNANRQAETLKLLTKGGWWDHSDGNRISTTMGDKVEVIQGNYKLVVLGRQQAPAPPTVQSPVNLQACISKNSGLLAALNAWYSNGQPTDPTSSYVTAIANNLTNSSGVQALDAASTFAYQVQVWLMTQNSFITDLSGGHFQEQYPSPTPCIKTIEYSQDNNNEWTLYQDNTQGNLITRLKGRTVDLFQGSSRETYVGSSQAGVLWGSGGATPSYTSPDTATTGDLRLDPMIASYTWAQSVYTQTGSESKPIGPPGTSPTGTNPNVSAKTGPQPSAVSASPSIGVSNGDVVSATWANRVATYTGSTAKPVGLVYSETHASNVNSITASTGGVASTIAAVGGVANTTTAVGAIVNTTAAAGAVLNWTGAAGAVVNGTGGGGSVVNLVGAGGPIANVNIAGLGGLAAGAALGLVSAGLAAVALVPIGAAVGSMFGAAGAGAAGGAGVAGSAGLAVANAAAGILGSITNINATFGRLFNINMSAMGIVSIDVAPTSYHVGVVSQEVAANKTVNALRVALGLSPT